MSLSLVHNLIYHNTLVRSTLIILFLKKIHIFKEQNYVKENIEYLRIFYLLNEDFKID